MKKLETYILEQEYNENFLIEEGKFFDWLKKVGKKFWKWLTDKDYSDKDTDWSISKNNNYKDLRWVNTDSKNFIKLKSNKGLFDNFPGTFSLYDNEFIEDKIITFQGLNKQSVPVIMISILENKDEILKILNKTCFQRGYYKTNYQKAINKIHNSLKQCIIEYIEVSKKNIDNDYIIYHAIEHCVNKYLCEKYSIIFLNKRSIKSNILRSVFFDNYNYDLSTDLPVIDGREKWWSISDDDKPGPTLPPKAKNTEKTKKVKKAKKTEPEEESLELDGSLNPVNETFDIENIFWMLNTWFANNELQKSLFLGLVDNCIIKKVYTKNDISMLCDKMNFEIRPFINFMSNIAVPDGQKEDVTVDYYNELKKLIDILISNKSTANTYVRRK